MPAAVPDDAERAISADETAATNARWLDARLVASGAASGAGEPAHRVDLHGDVQSVIFGIGHSLAALHALPIDDAPFDSGWEALRDHIADNLSAVDAAALPEPYCRYEAEELFRLWCEARPATEDLVVSHGNPTLDNIRLHRGEPAGLADLGAMRVVDRHFDLAIVQHSIHHHLGGEAVFIFFDAYGTDPDLLRLDHYTLASLLLS